MDTLLINCRERTRSAGLELLWRQWCALGVAGSVPAASAARLIDLDALVLATSSLARRDPRLFDEALDWLSHYGFLVNLQRVKNLHQGSGLGDKQVLAAMAEWLWKEAGQPRWKLFVPKDSVEKSKKREALFVEQEGLSARDPDPIFSRHGLERNRFEARGMSRKPNPEHPANLMPVLRALMGVSARVEILLYLGGTMGSAHATEIAHATGYSPRTLQFQLQEMLISGHIVGPPKSLDEDAPVRRGANRAYCLNDDLKEFLSPRAVFPDWTAWASLFRVSESVLELFPGLGSPATSPMVISSGLREVVTAEFKTLFADGIGYQLGLRPDAGGEAFLKDFCKGFPNLLEQLAEGNER